MKANHIVFFVFAFGIQSVCCLLILILALFLTISSMHLQQ